MYDAAIRTSTRIGSIILSRVGASGPEDYWSERATNWSNAVALKSRCRLLTLQIDLALERGDLPVAQSLSTCPASFPRYSRRHRAKRSGVLVFRTCRSAPRGRLGIRDVDRSWNGTIAPSIWVATMTTCTSFGRRSGESGSAQSLALLRDYLLNARENDDLSASCSAPAPKRILSGGRSEDASFSAALPGVDTLEGFHFTARLATTLAEERKPKSHIIHPRVLRGEGRR